jgi:hypothetical protein
MKSLEEMGLMNLEDQFDGIKEAQNSVLKDNPDSDYSSVLVDQLTCQLALLQSTVMEMYKEMAIISERLAYLEGPEYDDVS